MEMQWAQGIFQRMKLFLVSHKGGYFKTKQNNNDNKNPCATQSEP
jgi:hypothetical protein